MGIAEYRERREADREAMKSRARPAELTPVERIARDVATIRAVLVFWFVLTVLGLLAFGLWVYG